MTADASARVAWAGDANEIARLQTEAWREVYADVLPAEVLADLPVQEIAARWSESLAKPADARHRVLIALAGPKVHGFAVVQPAVDPDTDNVADGEITEFTIEAAHRGEGHGSRLLHACVDTLRADGFQRALLWLPSTADQARAWLTAMGWQPDGAHRELESENESRIKQVRLHVSLVENEALTPVHCRGARTPEPHA